MFPDDQGKLHETPDEIGIERKLDLILSELKNLEGAFPRNEDGSVDFDGHKRFHESKIKAAEAEARFWEELKLDIAKRGTWGLLIIILGLLAVGVGTKFGISVR